VIDASRVHGPRQLTDVYLLALAVRQGGRLVTFDKAIALDAVRSATPIHLLAL
jgi:predicted nucleic acid-binding protein